MEKNKSKDSDNVRVIVRCRPMNQTETESNCIQVVMVRNKQTSVEDSRPVVQNPKVLLSVLAFGCMYVSTFCMYVCLNFLITGNSGHMILFIYLELSQLRPEV